MGSCDKVQRHIRHVMHAFGEVNIMLYVSRRRIPFVRRHLVMLTVML